MGTRAQVITDGTVGVASALPGPNFLIGETLGTRVGTNLFHSFQTFNILNGQSATFTGGPGLTNVISRVTGGSPSTIDGGLRSMIPGAALWFLNPSGVIFGANARLDLPSSFYVGTGNEIQFADAAVYSATSPNASVLTVASPVAFGFLGNTPGAITLNGSNLSLVAGSTFTLAGGTITGSSSQLAVGRPSAIPGEPTAGTINLVAVSSANSVRVADGSVTKAADGAITLSGMSVLDTRGNGGGTVRIRGGQLVADGAAVRVDNFGELHTGEGISITASTAEFRNGAILQTSARGRGETGVINLNVGTLTIRDGSQINTSTLGEGKGGNVVVKSDALNVLSGASINSSTAASGQAGSLSIDAAKIVVSRQGAGGFTGITSQAAATATGNAGAVTIVTTSLDILGGAAIDSSTFGAGNAGSVDIQAKTIVLNGDATGQPSTIASAAFTQQSTGNAGTINLTTDRLALLANASVSSSTNGSGKAGAVMVKAVQVEVRQGSAIESSTFGNGDAGLVAIEADSVVLDKGTSPKFTGIASSVTRPEFLGNAGTVRVAADKIEIYGGAEISSSTVGRGNAGSVQITADQLLVSGNLSRVASESFGPGNAGAVILDIDDLHITSGGLVSSTTTTSGAGGSISLTTDRLRISGGTLASGTVQETPGGGRGGSVTIDAGEIELTGGGLITVSTRGTGQGGSASITADKINIRGTSATGQTSQIDSQTFGPGNAGALTIKADSITIAEQGRIVASTGSGGNAGDISVTVDDLDISGNITGISSDSGLGGRGNAGAITVNAETIRLSNGGLISTSVLNPGRASSGSISVSAQDIFMTNRTVISTRNDGSGLGGDVSIAAANSFTLQNSAVATTARAGDGGRINISGGYIDMRTSEITTSVGGAGGNGGDITFNNSILVQDNSIIRANAVGGNGGNITIAVEELLQHPGRVAIIEATSQLGISGNVNVSTPATDAVGGIAALPSNFLDSTGLLDEACAARIGGGAASSLVPAGRGGLPISPDDPGAPSYFATQPISGAELDSSGALLAREQQVAAVQAAPMWACGQQ